MLTALVLLGLAAPPASPAEAAAALPRIDASAFQLVAGSTFATYGERIAALETNPALAPVGVSAVLAAANRQGRDLCHPTFMTASLGPRGFCWADGEDDTPLIVADPDRSVSPHATVCLAATGCSPGASSTIRTARGNVWIPQGMDVDGSKVVASWHYSDDSAIRVSFLDLATLRYRHVLLVEPTSNGNFAAIAGHGHGLYLKGNTLVVATGGSVLRVFDLTHIWRTDTSTAEVGLGSDGKFHARYHAFALPQTGAFWYEGGGCANVSSVRPCFASLALDRAGSSFVAVEHETRGGGRIVRWPVSSSGLPLLGADGRVHATEAFASPVWGMQGAVAVGGYFVITGVCPEYADNIGDGVDYPSCLHRGVGGESTSVWTKAPKNTENLAYWPATDQLWLMNEQLRERVTVHVTWPG